MAFLATDYLKKITDNKNVDGDSLLMEKTRANFKSAAIGAGIGLVVGFSRKYNLLFSAVIGASMAAIISNYVISKMNTDEK